LVRNTSMLGIEREWVRDKKKKPGRREKERYGEREI